MLASIVLALVSALCFAAAGALQHRTTRALALSVTMPARRSRRWLPVLGLLLPMSRERIWWCGFACNVLGFAFHAVALHLGSITIVQALLCVQLMFALPFATARNRSLPLTRDWIGTSAVCLGIITLIAARGTVPQTGERDQLLPAVALAAVLIMVCLVALARLTRDTGRTALVGTGAGVGFSLTAVLTIVVADDLVQSGFAPLLASWHLYALALSGLLAAILVQDAFASGSFPAALTAMTAADPIAAWFWGGILFDQAPPVTPVALASLVTAGLLLCFGVAMLAYSPTITGTARQPAR